MDEQPDHTDSSLSETMAPRIEIKELGDPARETRITDAVAALAGVIETKIENSALHVSYDPWPRVKGKSSRLSAPAELLSKLRPPIQRLRIQICQCRQIYSKLLPQTHTRTNTVNRRANHCSPFTLRADLDIGRWRLGVRRFPTWLAH